jgi:hypothetical protein
MAVELHAPEQADVAAVGGERDVAPSLAVPALHERQVAAT